MKLHIGSDYKNGIVHSLHTTTAKISDVSEIGYLFIEKKKQYFEINDIEVRSGKKNLERNEYIIEY